MAHALPGGRREEIRVVGGGEGYVITMSNHGSK